MADDGLADVKGGQKVGDNMELEIDAPGCAAEAVEICPVQIIKVS